MAFACYSCNSFFNFLFKNASSIDKTNPLTSKNEKGL
jgi:hypothetical protein